MDYQAVIEKTRRRLLSGIREQVVTLTQPYVAGSDTIALAGTYFNAVQPGTILSVDLEQFYVEATTQAGSVVVQGGYQGSTPADHDLGAMCFINDRFPRFDIGVAINDDLLDLSGPTNGLGQILYIDQTFNPTYMGYDLGDTFDAVSSRILEITYKIAPPVRSYPLIRRGDYRTLRNQNDPSIFPSGNGVIIYQSAYPGLPIHIQFLSPFSPLVNLTDDLTTVAGLSPTMYDLPDLGAAIRLMDPREIKRNFIESQADPRKAPEVPPAATANSQVKLEKQRAMRIDAEYERIARAYPESEAW